MFSHNQLHKSQQDLSKKLQLKDSNQKVSFQNNYQEPVTSIKHHSYKITQKIDSLPSSVSAEQETNLKITGNIFDKRTDWSILKKLPISKQNTIHIRLDDEGPYGNDETRCLVLSRLSSLSIKSLPCIFCKKQCTIYDKFPLIDGTLFTTPQTTDTINSVPAVVSNRLQFIQAICLGCLLEEKNFCRACKKPWSNTAVQLGTLYKYDIIAAVPCCLAKVECKNCAAPLLNLNKGGFDYFSRYSEKITCSWCSTTDYHFIKSVNDSFMISNI